MLAGRWGNSVLREYGQQDMTTVTFRVTPGPDGGYVASAIGHSIVTQAETQLELEDAAYEAAYLHLGRPALVRFNPQLDHELINHLTIFSVCSQTKIPGEHPDPDQSSFCNFTRELKFTGCYRITDIPGHAS